MKKSGVIFHNKTRQPKKQKRLSLSFFVKAFFILFLAGVFFSNKNQSPFANIRPTVTPAPTITSTPTPSPTPLILPSKLIIEKLGVEAEVEIVGVDENGKMANPSNWNNVGWFRAGPIPGEPGNAVIAGHFDTNRGSPAIFYHLGELQPGDIFQIYKIDGKKLDFIVTGKEIYPYDQVPLDYIFASKTNPGLVLITCNGFFNNRIKSYSHRIAVFSEISTDSS